MGIRSRRAGLQSAKMKGIRLNRQPPIPTFQKEILPHVVIFLEQCIVLHSSLLKLHVNAAAVYWNHLFDSAERSFKFYRLAKEESNTTEDPGTGGLKIHSSLHAAETCGQLHDSSEGVTPGYRRGQVRHQEAFEHVQDFIFSHLKKKNLMNLSIVFCIMCMWMLEHVINIWVYLDGFLLLTLARYQQVSILSYAPGCYLH